jgi:cellulose synthase/poly-beta-1,6-N-acetylglucosamine synthase-like glycosyltransferase
MIYLFSIVGLLFAGLLLAFTSGLLRRNTKSTGSIIPFTILIPVSGESLENLIRLHQQLLPENPNLEVVFVVDHISLSEEDLRALENSPMHSVIFPPPEHRGKKNVMRFAMETLKTDWFLWMDADVIPNETLFQRLPALISPEIKMLLVPLKPKTSLPLHRAFFDLEFLVLHSVGCGSASLNLPLLNNAACLLISRQAFIETIDSRNDWHLLSGDDVFAMHAIANRFGGKAIRAVQPSQIAPQEIAFSNRFVDLWLQRLRWMAKSPQISSLWFKFVSFVVLVSEISLVVGITLFLENEAWAVPIMIVILAQFIYLLFVVVRFGRRDLALYILPSLLLYPLYLISLLIGSLIVKPKWKTANNVESIRA